MVHQLADQIQQPRDSQRKFSSHRPVATLPRSRHNRTYRSDVDAKRSSGLYTPARIVGSLLGRPGGKRALAFLDDPLAFAQRDSAIVVAGNWNTASRRSASVARTIRRRTLGKVAVLVPRILPGEWILVLVFQFSIFQSTK
jgi:hypothetical protein